MKEREEIPIFFTIDSKYVPYVSCAIISIIENGSKNNLYKINILHDGLTEEEISTISKLQCENAEIKFEEMKEGMELITDRIENRLRCDYFTLTIYFRLFIADLFPQYDKGIYIDSDIIVKGDISELYNKDLGDNIIGASMDHSIQGIPEFVSYVENAVGVERNKYVNSGVLLMNLKQMREKEFSKKFLSLLNTYHFDSVAPDQDYLNAMCYNKVLYLDEEWDAMPAEGKKEISDPKLIHYNLFSKPWCYDNVQYEDEFWKYAKKSSYYDKIIENKNNYSDEQKQSDEASIGTMLNKAVEISSHDVTFKKMFENGKDIRI